VRLSGKCRTRLKSLRGGYPHGKGDFSVLSSKNGHPQKEAPAFRNEGFAYFWRIGDVGSPRSHYKPVSAFLISESTDEKEPPNLGGIVLANERVCRHPLIGLTPSMMNLPKSGDVVDLVTRTPRNRQAKNCLRMLLAEADTSCRYHHSCRWSQAF
jgi:hypothetical protein